MGVVLAVAFAILGALVIVGALYVIYKILTDGIFGD